MLSIRRAVLAALAATFLFAVPAAMSAQANHVVISQVYGGGGGTSASTTYTYNTDYVELYNPTTQAVSLQGMSIQYGSSTGQFGSVATNIKTLTGTIQPGKYYLVTGATGTQGGTLPVTADESGSFSLSATSGKVALVGNSTAATACTGGTVVDEVSYGGAANVSCAETTAVAALSNTTAALRTPPSADSDNNSADFSVGTPNPHNSASAGTSTASLAVASASANPASVAQGGSAVLSVVVTPGQNSTGITVVADLSSIGGSSTQAFPLSSTANTYTYTLQVPGGAAANTYSFPVTAADGQGGRASGAIALTVTPASTATPIATVQANRSNYVGSTIQVQGVVTVVTSAGYYLQTPSATPGSTGDEGIYVYAGTGKVPASVAVGNLITVTGTLTLYPTAANSRTPSLEITSASVTNNGTATLPSPIVLPAGIPTAGGGLYQLTKYESMLVRFPSLTASGPTDGNLTETTETIVSNGQFYAVATGTARPFREPGMDFRDYPAATCPSVGNCTATATTAGVARPSAVVLFDDNPERVIVESSLGGGTPVDVSTGAVLTNVTGVLDFTYSSDSFGDPARIIVRPGTLPTSAITAGVTVQPLAVPSAGQVTVAAFNIERFFNTDPTDNKYYNAGTGTVSTSSAVNVTQEAYTRRLAKLSLAVRNVLNAPDVIGFEEVENVSVLRDLSARIDADAAAAGKAAPGYVAYGTDSTTTYTDDIGGISVGFLVKPSTTNVVRWEQIGQKSTFTASTGVQTLNDRPSQVLHVGFKRANGARDYLMTLIVNHLRSLSGISTSADTRLKKELQAEALATAIQGYQAAGERVLAFGDMNAFEFSDGYTDTLGTITGVPSKAGTSVQSGPASPITNPAATDLALLLLAPDRRSYDESGNAQILDHVVATSNVVAQTQLAYAHLNADFPLILTNDATTPARISDHDAALTYVAVPAAIVSGTLTGSGAFPSQVLGSSSAGQQFVLTNTGEAPIVFTSITSSGDFTQSNTCGSTLAIGATCQINVVFTPTAAGARTGTLTVSSTASGIGPVTLSGTGTVPPTFTFTAGGASSYSITVARGNAAQATLTLTPTSTFSGTVTFSCTGLPANTSCEFTPSTLTLATGSSAQSIGLLLRTSTLSSSVRDSRSNAGSGLVLAFTLPGLLLAGLGVRGRRAFGSSRLLLAGFLLLGLAGTVGLTGCGSTTTPNYTRVTQAAAGTTTFTVVATSATVTQTIPVTLTIQ